MVLVDDLGNRPRPIEPAGDLPPDLGVSADQRHLLVGQPAGPGQQVDGDTGLSCIVDRRRIGQSYYPPFVEAERALYVDFEGTAVDPPSLLGVLCVEQAKTEFTQLVIEEALWPAAEAKTADSKWTWACKQSVWGDLARLRERSEVQDRRIVAWSEHERVEMVAHAPSDSDQAWFDENVINALPLGRKWQRQFRPDAVMEKDPENWMRGRHQLQKYFDLIGYEVDPVFGPGHSADRIRTVRDQLVKRSGVYKAVTPVAKAKWTKALKHNFYDCDGLRAVMIQCATDQA